MKTLLFNEPIETKLYRIFLRNVHRPYTIEINAIHLTRLKFCLICTCKNVFYCFAKYRKNVLYIPS